MKKLTCFIVTIFLIVSCGKEEKSGETSILSYTISSAGSELLLSPEIRFDDENNIISLFSDGTLPDNIFPGSLTPDISISDHARISPASGKEVTFTDRDSYVTYTVTAEDGTEAEWYVLLRDNQLPDAGFDDWFETTGMNGQPFMEPGRSQETTIWATANMGTSIYGVYCTTPLADDNNTLVEIITGETETVPVTAGTIFTGKFDVSGAINNPTNPQMATHFGIPFIYRPVALKLEYSYTAGEEYIHGTLNDPENIFGGFTVSHPEGSDSCKIYSYLEVWNGDERTTVAEFLYISGTSGNDRMMLTLPYTYFSDLQPTHLSLIFSSSKDGDLFTGSVGSRLIIDNLEFLYE